MNTNKTNNTKQLKIIAIVLLVIAGALFLSGSMVRYNAQKEMKTAFSFYQSGTDSMSYMVGSQYEAKAQKLRATSMALFVSGFILIIIGAVLFARSTSNKTNNKEEPKI